jgi:hypothetical protein
MRNGSCTLKCCCALANALQFLSYTFPWLL